MTRKTAASMRKSVLFWGAKSKPEFLLMRFVYRLAAASLAFIICVSSQAQNDSAAEFPLFTFQDNGLYGYTDARGAVVISPQFLFAEDFAEGFASVELCTDYGRRWGFIDRTGKVVIAPAFDDTSDFSDGLAAVEVGGAWGFIDRLGKTVIRPRYKSNDVLPEYKFSEGLAAVNIGERWGYINKSGKLVIRARFDHADPFHEGMAGVEINGKEGYVDTTGKLVITPQFDLAVEFSEGLARVNVGYTRGLNSNERDFRAGLWGYIDRAGHFVIKPQFNFADSFYDDRALVRTDNGTGFIDKTGRLVIADKYQDADGFSEGLAPVKLDNKWGYIDRAGQTVIPFQFGESRSFVAGIADTNNWNNRINRQGEIIWTRPREIPAANSAAVECEPKIKPPEPTPQQIAARRREVHKLMLEGKYQHGGAAELLYIGDMTSVPALLRVLKDHPPILGPNGQHLYICTYSHAVAALSKITGQKFTSYAEWSAWWEEKRKRR